MRTPSAQPPPDLRRHAVVYLVRYVDTRGETVSRLHRTEPAARRFAQRVREVGGSPRVYASGCEWLEVGRR